MARTSAACSSLRCAGRRSDERTSARKAGITHAQVVDAAEPAEPSAALRALVHAYRTFGHDQPGLYAALRPAPRPDDDPEGAALAAETVAVVAAVLDGLGITPTATAISSACSARC